MGETFRAVTPMSRNGIEGAAAQLRDLLGLEPDSRVQMMNLLELVLPEVLPDYQFGVLPDEMMPGIDGLSTIGSFNIYLAEHTYMALSEGDPEARLTAAHELGHLILHSFQKPALARRTHNDERVDPEWQADYFAEVWLMPRAGVLQCSSAQEVADRFSVPLASAQFRFGVVCIDKFQGDAL